MNAPLRHPTAADPVGSARAVLSRYADADAAEVLADEAVMALADAVDAYGVSVVREGFLVRFTASEEAFGFSTVISVADDDVTVRGVRRGRLQAEVHSVAALAARVAVEQAVLGAYEAARVGGALRVAVTLSAVAHHARRIADSAWAALPASVQHLAEDLEAAQ